MRSHVSRVLRWVRRADGTRRTHGRHVAPSNSLARRARAGWRDGIDLSAPAAPDVFEPPFRLEAFSLETFGEPDVFPRLPRAASPSAATEREPDSHVCPPVELVAPGARSS